MTPSTPQAPESVLEKQLAELLLPTLTAELSPPTARGRGRPAVLPAAMLWLGILVGILRGGETQRAVWRLLSLNGLWALPRLGITDEALYQRLRRLPVARWQDFFTLVTQALLARREELTATGLADWAPQIIALDHTQLDAVLRKVKQFRDCAKGDLQLLPGSLACAFDVRRQLWLQALFQERVGQPWDDFSAFLDTLKPKTLLLFDLGFFSFEWFDALSRRELCFVCRLRKRVTWETLHVLCERTLSDVDPVGLRDTLVYLGIYRANRAGYPLRLIEIQRGTVTYSYLTNVTDVRLLPAWQVAELYRRRWDIESAFNLVKTHLGMRSLWSGHRNVLLHQVLATFIVAQVVLGFRNEVAAQAGCDLREISLPLLLQEVPQLAQNGHDPLALIVAEGRRFGFIRSFRGQDWQVPQPDEAEYSIPEEILTRKARYPNRETYLTKQKAVRAEKRAAGSSTYSPHGNKYR